MYNLPSSIRCPRGILIIHKANNKNYLFRLKSFVDIILFIYIYDYKILKIFFIIIIYLILISTYFYPYKLNSIINFVRNHFIKNYTMVNILLKDTYLSSVLSLVVFDKLSEERTSFSIPLPTTKGNKQSNNRKKKKKKKTVTK